MAGDPRRRGPSETLYALRPTTQAISFCAFGSLPTPTVPKPISQSLRSPLAAACVLWPLIEHCCALFSRVSLIGRALFVGGSRLLSSTKAPERRFSCRLASLGEPGVGLVCALASPSDIRYACLGTAAAHDLSGRGQHIVRYVLFAFPPLRAYGPAPQTSPYL